MSMLTQIRAVTMMNLRSIPQRLGTSSVIVVGIAGVVAVLVSVLAMANGFQETLAGAGRPDRVIVLRGGSGTELSSSLTRDEVLTILDAPGVKKDAEGHPIGSADLVSIVGQPLKASGTDANLT